MWKCISSRRWAVVWICCFINFTQMSPARLGGMFFVALMDSFGASRKAAALPFTLVYGVRSIFGPCVGYLGSRYGLRRVTFLGCALSAIGVIMCFLAKEIIAFTILWGVIYGVGFSMSTSFLPQILSRYFPRRSAVVNGIILSGDCLGGLLLPHLVDSFLKRYGLNGCLLLLGAIILQSVPVSMLLWTADEKKFNPTLQKSTLLPNSEKCNGILNMDNFNQKCSESEMAGTLDIVNNTRNDTHSNNPSDYVNLNTYRNDISCISKVGSQDITHNTFKGDVIESVSEMEVKANHYDASKECSKENEQISNKSTPNQPLNKSPFRVFLDQTFILISFTQSTKLYICVFITTIVVDIARDAGIPQYQEPLLLMSISIFGGIGRLFLGFIPDSGYVTNYQFAAICSTLMGLCFIFPIFIPGFQVIFLLMSIFGLCVGGVTTVFAGICTDFIEKDHITMALASRFLLLVPLSLTQSPLIDLFRDRYGSYNGLLTLLFILSLFCAGTSLLTPVAARRRDRRKTKHCNDSKEPEERTI